MRPRGKPSDPPTAQALWDALVEYRSAKARLAGVQPCLSGYPADPPRPGYAGTRCDLLAGHDKSIDPTEHRHRFPGTRVVVTW